MKRPGLNMAMMMALAGLGLTGCFFSVDTKTCSNDASLCVVPSATGVTGKVTDGAVAFTTVTLDTNDDRICESDEPSTQADANGNYSFDAALGSHMVCAQGGTDIATGLPLVGVLLAPAGATQITPLTNLVMAQLNAATPPVAGTSSPIDPKIAFSAAASMANQLGLSGDSFLTADPVAEAGSNPALLQTTEAIQALMVQTVSLLQSVGGDDSAEPGSGTTNALYADAGSALSGVLKSLSLPLTTAKLGNVAVSLLSAATTKVQGDSALSGLTGLSGVLPASMAAFAGPTLASMTDAVAGASTTSLLAPNQYNLAAQEQANVSLVNTVTALAPVLLTSSANLSSEALGGIASTALPLGATGVPRAAPSANTVAAITRANSAIVVPANVQTELDNANLLNDVTQVAGVRINCGAAACPQGTLRYNQPLVTSLVSVGPFTNVIVSLTSPVGIAVKGGTASSVVATGTGIGQAIPGTEQDSSMQITVVNQASGNPQQLTLMLDHVVLYQTNVVVNDATVMAVEGVIPPNAILTVKATGDTGPKVSAQLDAAAAARVLSVQPSALGSPGSSEFKLDIAALIRALGQPANNFPLLSDFNSNLAGSGNTYLITTSLPGLKLSTLSRSTPARTRSFALQLGF